MAVDREWMGRMRAWRESDAGKRQGALVEMEVALDRAAVLVAQGDVGGWEHYLGVFVNKVVALGRERGVSEEDLTAFVAVVYEQSARRLIKVL